MGLPVERLIVATNINDILHRAISGGDYSTGTVTPTAAPSMDIQISSNFERLLFDLGGRDGDATARIMAEFDKSRSMKLSDDMLASIRKIFISHRIDPDDMAMATRWAQEEAGQVIDPHTAIGLSAAHKADIDPAVPIITLATAHPAKFRDAVERACGVRPALPRRIGDLFDREESYTKLPGDYDSVREFITTHARPANG